MVERCSLKAVVTGSIPVTPSMKKYEIVGKIVLSFIFDDEQRDFLLEPKENCYLESDGNTVWYVQKDEKFESITTANVIDVGLKRGDLKLVD